MRPSSHNALFSNSLAAVHQRTDPLNPPWSHRPISHHCCCRCTPPRCWWCSKSAAIKVNESRSIPQRQGSRWRHNQWNLLHNRGGLPVGCHHLYRWCNRCSVAVVSTGTRVYHNFTPPQWNHSPWLLNTFSYTRQNNRSTAICPFSPWTNCIINKGWLQYFKPGPYIYTFLGRNDRHIQKVLIDWGSGSLRGKITVFLCGVWWLWTEQ